MIQFTFEYIKAIRGGRNPLEPTDRGATLGEVFNTLLSHRNLKTKTTSDYRNTVNICFGDWIDQPITIISRQRIEDRFHRIGRERGKAQAAKAFRILSTICNDAVASDLLPSNPVHVLSLKRVDRYIKPRDRYLPFEKLHTFLEACRGYPNQVIGNYLALLLFTGLRRSEAASLRWEDVSPDYFTIRDTKNRTDHTLPIVPAVRSILSKPHQHPTWVFPNRLGTGPLAEPQKAVKRISTAIDFEFTCHDLRRTFASIAHHVGIDYVTVQRLMNHKNKSITERYIQHHPEQLRAPLQRIADVVLQDAGGRDSAGGD